MRLLLAVWVCGTAAAAPPPPAAATSPETSQALAVQEAFRGVASTAKPAVVSINSVFKQEVPELPFVFGDPDEFLRHFFGENHENLPRNHPRWRHITGIGSGVITDARGYVLTNEHVVGGAEEIKVIVKAPEEKSYKGKIVGTDPYSDLAVVKIQGKGPFSAVALGDSDQVRVGDWAIAVGSPFGLEQTVTVGVISALRQSIKVEDRDYSDFFQTDAAINEGNSGGPLLDIRGRIIGINTAIFSPTGVFGGIGFAIPSNQAARIMKELIDKGRVVRGWLGVEIAPIDEVLARQFKLPSQKGALINSVVPGSPAAKAGVQRGDVVVEFDGKTVPSPGDLMKMVEATRPGARITMRMIREGRAKELTLSVGNRPAKVSASGAPPHPNAEEGGALSEWQGARVRNADESLEERFRLPRGAKGAVVTDVAEGSPAAEMGLRPGDLIQAINGRRVENASAFADAARVESLETGVVLDINRAGHPLYLSYRRGE